MKNFNGLDRERVLPILRAALKEDIGKADITTIATVHKLASGRAGIIAREDGVICGLPIVEMILNIMDYSIRVKPTVNEGDLVSEGKEVVFIEGRIAPVLTAERTMLNFLAFLSGIATKTRQFADKAKKYDVKILDTRKTVPLMRYLEKYAVRVGGGYNHRMGLWDQVLVKDNHIKIVRCLSGLAREKMPSIKDVVKKAAGRVQKNIKIEVETQNLKEFEEVLEAGPDIIMLDNMDIADIKRAVELRSKAAKSGKDKILLEVSGGITLDNVENYAGCGIDMISIGALTKDVQSLDLSLEIVG